jgi:hypothetical protein
MHWMKSDFSVGAEPGAPSRGRRALKQFTMEKYANNRAELSHRPIRERERGMRRSDVSDFKSMKQAQRLLNAHLAVYNLINLGWVETASFEIRGDLSIFQIVFLYVLEKSSDGLVRIPRSFGGFDKLTW